METNSFNVGAILDIPIAIVLGILLGVIGGLALSFLFKKTNFPNAVNVLLVLTVSFLFVGLENILKGPIYRFLLY